MRSTMLFIGTPRATLLYDARPRSAIVPGSYRLQPRVLGQEEAVSVYHVADPASSSGHQSYGTKDALYDYCSNAYLAVREGCFNDDEHRIVPDSSSWAPVA